MVNIGVRASDKVVWLKKKLARKEKKKQSTLSLRLTFLTCCDILEDNS